MTIASLLGLPASDIAKLSDADIEQLVKPYWPATRPDGGRSVQLNLLTDLMRSVQATLTPEQLAMLEENRKRKEAEALAVAKGITLTDGKIKLR